MIPIKRVDLIIESIHELSKLTYKKIEWVHIGDGELLESIQSKYSDLLSRIEAHFLGYMDNDRIHTFYATQHIDVFINLSDSEGIPVSMMEAIAYDIPLMGRNVGGVAEVVNESTGVLLPTEVVPEEVAKKLHRLINTDKKELKPIDYYEANHNAAINFEVFYENLLSK